MGRSLKKGPFVDPKLLRRVEAMNQTGRREAMQTWHRSCTIVPEFIGHTFMVHNGKMFHKVFVTEDMVGHKLGEFSPTRVFRGHTMARAKEAAATT
ncbi:MAG: 30S ribosomal protein S19 [Phycisphaerae bacterium]|nr:30S ribosomal protein S19 [Phycisphaerae bacterium]